MHDNHVQIMVINVDGHYTSYRVYTGQVWVECSARHFTVMGKMVGHSSTKDVCVGRFSLNRFAFNQERLSDADKIYTPQWEEGNVR